MQCREEQESKFIKGTCLRRRILQGTGSLEAIPCCFGLVLPCLMPFSVQPGVLSCCFVEEERSGSF